MGVLGGSRVLEVSFLGGLRFRTNYELNWWLLAAPARWPCETIGFGLGDEVATEVDGLVGLAESLSPRLFRGNDGTACQPVQ